MIINIATVGICFLMLVIFRRMDKSNVKMAKLRRYSGKIFEDFKKMAEKESRQFHDATIEMDILLKKSGAVAKSLGESISEIENRLKGLDIEKNNLKKVDEDLKVISSAAKDVNKQIQFIATARESFADLSKSVTLLQDSVDNMNLDLNNNIQNFEDRLRERSRDISEEFYINAENLKIDLERRENEMSQSSRERVFKLTEEFTNNMTAMEKRVSESEDILVENFKIKISPLIKTVENAENLNRQLNNLQETFSTMENTFFDEFKSKTNEMKSGINSDIEKLRDKMAAVEGTITESRTKLIQSFENEVSKVRTELDNLSIHAVSKKDEIIQATRREAEGIKKTIEDFEDKFMVLENRMIDTAEEKIDNIDSEYQNAEMRLNTLITKIRDEETQMERGFELLENRLGELRTEIVKYEQNNEVFGKADELMRKVNEFEKFTADIEQIKELKKTADKEIRTYMARKEKLADIENEIKGLMEVNDIVMEKSDKLLDSVSKVDSVNSRIDALTETYSMIDRKINELREYEDTISRNLDSVSKSDLIIQSIDSRIKSFESVMDRSDKKLDSIGGKLKRVEEEALILKTKEGDIREVKDRLNEIDSLSGIMEERIKQIQAMFQKVEGIRREIDFTDSKLQQMYDATDQKMKEFSDFIQAVDNNNPILKQVKGNAGAIPGKNLNDGMVRTVRELSNKGWDPESISRKLMIDENSIRFIINTTSL